MPSNDNFRTCICKHITPLDTCWPIVRHFMTFWNISSNFEQIWATLTNFEQFWAILSSFKQFWTVFSGQLGSFRAILSIFVGQVWVMSSSQFWTIFGRHCWPWTVFNMFQLRLLWDILRWMKKVADVNPTDLDPKTRSVNYNLVLFEIPRQKSSHEKWPKMVV